MASMIFETTNAPIFGRYVPAIPKNEPAVQSNKLRSLALTGLIDDLDSLHRDAQRIAGDAERAASQLRQLRPLLPAADETIPKRKKR